jgi:heme exporter protein A
MLAELMGKHLSGGGLILAATHMAIGLTSTRELRLGAAA